MVAVTYYGYGVSVTSQANKPAFSLKGASYETAGQEGLEWRHAHEERSDAS
jgi:hypothetical protein